MKVALRSGDHAEKVDRIPVICTLLQSDQRNFLSFMQSPGRECLIELIVSNWCHTFAERLELSDTIHGIPMQSGRPNGVRSSDWLDGKRIMPDSLYPI